MLQDEIANSPEEEEGIMFGEELVHLLISRSVLMVICMFLRVLDPIKENYIESNQQNKHLDISCGRLSTSKDDYRCPTEVFLRYLNL
jgi:hypothetical protein